MAKLDSENKNMLDEKDDEEFEIPDLSLIEQYPEMMAETEAEEPSAAEEPKKKRAPRKKTNNKSKHISQIEAGNNAEVESEPATEAVAEAEAEPETEAVAEAEAEPETEAVAEAEAEPETETVAEAETGKDSAGDEDPAENESPLSKFELDENGRRVIPEDIFPDDALSAPMPAAPDGTVIIDLLGDPVSDEDDNEGEVDTSILGDSLTPIETNEPKPDTEEKYDPDKPRRVDVIFDFVELLIFTLVAVLFVTSFFVKHAVVDGGSMLNTLEHGDVLIISDLFYDPEPGDVIVFEDHTLASEAYHKPLVKRVIAVEGQRVLVQKDGIYVSYANSGSKPLYESYVHTDDPYYEYDITRVSNDIAELESFGANAEGYWFIVPEGEIFVLGDHRDDSTDSRAVGTIRTDAILGKVLFRIYPFDKIGGVEAADYK